MPQGSLYVAVPECDKLVTPEKTQELGWPFHPKVAWQPRLHILTVDLLSTGHDMFCARRPGAVLRNEFVGL